MISLEDSSDEGGLYETGKFYVAYELKNSELYQPFQTHELEKKDVQQRALFSLELDQESDDVHTHSFILCLILGSCRRVVGGQEWSRYWWRCTFLLLTLISLSRPPAKLHRLVILIFHQAIKLIRPQNINLLAKESPWLSRTLHLYLYIFPVDFSFSSKPVNPLSSPKQPSSPLTSSTFPVSDNVGPKKKLKKKSPRTYSEVVFIPYFPLLILRRNMLTKMSFPIKMECFIILI